MEFPWASPTGNAIIPPARGGNVSFWFTFHSCDYNIVRNCAHCTVVVISDWPGSQSIQTLSVVFVIVTFSGLELVLTQVQYLKIMSHCHIQY